MATCYKSEVLAAQLKDNLSKFFTVVSDVLYDANGVPYITIGAMTTGTQSALVRVFAVQPLGVDGLGMTPRSFGPNSVQIALETSATANLAFLTAANSALLLLEAGKTGAKVELYMRTTGTAPALADFIADNLKAEWYTSTKWKMASAS
jgi:hypothetical protein